MPENLLLYSTNTWLAYIIAQTYYDNVHYAWCSPYFDCSSIPLSDQTIPASSTPGEIFRGLYQDVITRDGHSEKIKRNRAGIRRGAIVMFENKLISERQKFEIFAVVKKATYLDFRPIIYVIPYSLVAHLIVEVPVMERAHPLSQERRIERLPRNCFDIIDILGGIKYL
jgi:hypothetical protein